MLVSIIAVVIAAAAFALVAYPLLRERREQAPALGMPDEYEQALEDLVAQRDATYAAIKELDFDQEMGNLPEADYRELRDRYRLKAATILRDLDELQEAPLAKRRRPAAGPEAAEEMALAEDDIEREVRRRRRAQRRAAEGRRVCPSCGSFGEPEDQFCAGCGAPVAAGCPRCGVAYQAEDRFCARCGGSLPAGVTQ